MVLYKRKEFALLPPPANISDSTEVYVMRGTNEVFVDYEKYIRRYEYLSQKKFTDAVNGKSGLNFWDALESETKSKADLEDIFPPPLKDPILRKVQFSTVSRIDDLVNTVFDEFKKDFFPGESVIAILPPNNEQQLPGFIREKAKFPMIRGPDGTVQRPAFSRYFVSLDNVGDREALLDDKSIRRARGVFTKQNLRAFLRGSLQRESWIGAPWLVKEHLAIKHRLPMEIPSHLLQDAKLLANKVLQVRPPKGRRSNKTEEIARQQQELVRLQSQQPGATPQQLAHYHHQALTAPNVPKPAPPPPPKYPIEDLDVPPKHNGSTRPQLKFLTDEQREYVLSGRRISFEDFSMSSTGQLLEVWNTLNVQCEVYVLDSFTFDDFEDAMRYRPTQPTCRLLEEVHCAVLSQLVDKSGKVLVGKGYLDTVIDEESASDGHNESELSTPQPDVPARSTRSKLSHVDLAVDNPRTPSGDKPHRALEMLGERSWKARLAARDFVNGGWQVILVGVLHQLSLNPAFKHRCEKILTELAPVDYPATQQTALERYAELNLDLRISALQLITMLSVTTVAIKEFLEACSEDMTDVRKRKIEFQRQKKACMEDLAIKDREYKILLPQNMPDSPKAESVEPIAIEDDEDETLETNGAASDDAEEEDAPRDGRRLRRASDRKRKRDEEAARREKVKADKAEAAKNKQSKEFKKLCKEIDALKDRIQEIEAAIQECDADLREANVQRTRMLGKDRFCNRYYWFERNGMPHAGLPRSSTAEYGYANGRLWVQGPEEMEANGFIYLMPDEQREYRARFGMTTLERRNQEEGATSLLDAHEWGYIDDPDRLDNLIGWFDDRGEREKKLKREICDWRDTIAQYMTARKRFLEAEEAKKKAETEEEEAVTSHRVSTRHRAQQQEEEHSTAQLERCCRWTNSMAIEEMGHLHSRPAKKPAIRVKGSKNAQQQQQQQQANGNGNGKGAALVMSRSTGKPVTRQGSRYAF